MKRFDASSHKGGDCYHSICFFNLFLKISQVDRTKKIICIDSAGINLLKRRVYIFLQKSEVYILLQDMKAYTLLKKRKEILNYRKAKYTQNYRREK